jgi:hypothetical protein
MTYQKIIPANPYRAGNVVMSAMPTGVSQKVLGENTDVNIGITEQLLPYPTNYRNISLLNVGQVVKSRPGSIYGLSVTNTANGVRYLKIYNTAVAATTSDTPVITIAIPAGQTITWPENQPLLFFSIGISVRSTTGVADSDNVAPSANEVVLNLIYR